MSTKGLYGVRKNGVDKLTYNNADSYPSWLGDQIIMFIKENSNEKLNKFFDLVKVVDENIPPRIEDIDVCVRNGYTDLDVSARSVGDWYCLTRELQGNFKVYSSLINLEQTIYMIDNHEFIYDSLFCEYAYIINLDDNTLEYYVGFQQKPDKENRYGIKSRNNYYPCKMLKAYPLDEIRTRTSIDVTREMEELDEGIADES